ncbi:methyltransferase domain-containing protein [Marinobacter mobilis]|uniref:Ubiquinone/menaquinone biosynthesis C-methylase UbiE n=1 Tax=Marinobacter mobilis TaxID=488533 RepID=A0A1H2SJQ9_9GAMM|nr:methyltransferase domain-containing protein [Marinobacter mobilis]SDW31758.1 Ubiquinone/menaquinone biosynthesis C-methylase UbiE [Marinobacter mobilis]
MNGDSERILENTARDYDSRLGPSLFAPWAKHTISGAHLRPGDRILDVACGTGAVALAAEPRVAPDGHVTGLDPNPGMLAVARSKSASVDWQQGSVESLPFEDNQFDAVTCQFGLMLFPDPVGALVEMQRVLKPGRHLVTTVFDDIDNLPVYRILAETYGQVADPAIAELLRAPFSMGSRHVLNGLFAAATIPDTELLTRREDAHFASVEALVLADIRGWFPFAGIDLDETVTEKVIAAAGQALKDFTAANGGLRFPVSAHLVIATKRHANGRIRQQAI